MTKMIPLLHINGTDFHAKPDGITEGCPKVGSFSFKLPRYGLQKVGLYGQTARSGTEHIPNPT